MCQLPGTACTIGRPCAGPVHDPCGSAAAACPAAAALSPPHLLGRAVQLHEALLQLAAPQQQLLQLRVDRAHIPRRRLVQQAGARPPRSAAGAPAPRQTPRLRRRRPAPPPPTTAVAAGAMAGLGAHRATDGAWLAPWSVRGALRPRACSSSPTGSSRGQSLMVWSPDGVPDCDIKPRGACKRAQSPARSRGPACVLCPPSRLTLPTSHSAIGRPRRLHQAPVWTDQQLPEATSSQSAVHPRRPHRRP